MTAIITLVRTKEGFKDLIHLFFELFEFLSFLSPHTNFIEFCIRASDRNWEFKNPIKMTAIITLVGIDEG